jgi:pyrimidine-nucleoside phosphorylase
VLAAIARKRDGGEHPPGEVEAIVAEAVAGTIPDYQLAAWLMAVTCRGMSAAESSALTAAMVASGETLSLGRLGQAAVDEHSTGGVGDKVALIADPLAAASGVRVPRLSGRGLVPTAGTLDQVESLPGVTVDLEPEPFLRQVEEVGIAIAARPERMVPAERILCRLRGLTGTVPSVPLIASSLMSGKLASGAAGIVFNVTFGPGALVPSFEAASRLAARLIDIGSLAGRRVTALVTAGEAPLGHAVGSALEVREAVEVLEGGGDPDLREVAVSVAAEMGALAGILANPATALESGAALGRFWALVEAQGGRPGVLPEVAPEACVVAALGDGWVQAVDAPRVGGAVLDLGGGRHRRGEPIDHGVGVLLEAIPGAEVRWGDPLCRVYARSPSAAAAVEPSLRAAWTLGPDPPARGPRVRGRLTSSPFPRA